MTPGRRPRPLTGAAREAAVVSLLDGDARPVCQPRNMSVPVVTRKGMNELRTSELEAVVAR